LIGPLLYATTNKVNPWNPTSVNNWRSASISLNDFIGNDPIMIKVDFISGGGNNAFLDDFELSVTLDHEELSEEDISIYPNPSQGNFQVRGLPTGTAYDIISMDGRSVKRGTIPTSSSIELHAAAGYYLFQAGNVRKPIVIQ
ncbi:MAG: T9SS type A sorting domain-containing protein, partial [Schleiferiaceae bacterium]|nr:T9SS type A sorting domain-containing protein [Schleiferiaceae bacterium]